MHFLPDKIFKTIADITPEILSGEGIRGLILDIDYTLAPKSAALPEESVKTFISALKEQGVKLYIISNNHKNRVSIFAEALGLPYICNGFKPFPRSFRRAVRRMGLEPGEVAAVGDQIYTDVFGAHTAGLKAWMVLPVGSGSSVFYRFRQMFETPFVRRYYRNAGKGGE